MEIPLIYALTPDFPPELLPDWAACGHMGFCLSSQEPFFRPSSETCPDGWLLLPDGSFPAFDQVPACIREIGSYLSRSKPAGIYLDFESPPDEPRREFVRQMDQLAHSLQIPLVVPEPYIPATSYAAASIPARLLGGTLEGRLKEAAEHYENGVCLELILGAVVMKLPCLKGEVRLCSLEEALELAAEKAAAVHHSREFCCDYFLFCEDEQAYCVLLDTAACLEEKYRLAQTCGVQLCIGLAPELGSEFHKKDSLPQ